MQTLGSVWLTVVSSWKSQPKKPETTKVANATGRTKERLRESEIMCHDGRLLSTTVHCPQAEMLEDENMAWGRPS